MGFRLLAPDCFDESARIADESAMSTNQLPPTDDESDEHCNSNDEQGTSFRHNSRNHMPSGADSSGSVDRGMCHAAQGSATQTFPLVIHRMHQFPEFE
jgi:hypothetical protein